jgi:hypothetical protein
MVDKAVVNSGHTSQKVSLKVVQRNTEKRNLLNASKFGFYACHNMTLPCMRPVDHLTLNYNNKMSMTSVFLDIQKAFNTTWHPGTVSTLPHEYNCGATWKK